MAGRSKAMAELSKGKKKCKQMKVFDVTKLRDMAEAVASQIMLTVMATLCIRFIIAYMAATARFYALPATPILLLTYARKRVINRIAHLRKFALFTCGGGQGCLKGDRPI